MIAPISTGSHKSGACSLAWYLQRKSLIAWYQAGLLTRNESERYPRICPPRAKRESGNTPSPGNSPVDVRSSRVFDQAASSEGVSKFNFGGKVSTSLRPNFPAQIKIGDSLRTCRPIEDPRRSDVDWTISRRISAFSFCPGKVYLRVSFRLVSLPCQGKDFLGVRQS